MQESKLDDRPLIGIVGPCGSGKSTISAGLMKIGLNIKPICQEHSYVPNMWQRLTHPAVLVFLDASYLETIRRKRLRWTMEEYLEQHHRLRHARAHADIYLHTDGFTPGETMHQLLTTLLGKKLIFAEDYNLPDGFPF